MGAIVIESIHIWLLILTIIVAASGGLVQIGRWIARVTVTLERLDLITEDHEARIRRLEG